MQRQLHKSDLKIGMSVNIIAGKYARKFGTITGLTEKMVYVQLADQNIAHIRIMKSSVKPLIFDAQDKCQDTNTIDPKELLCQKLLNILSNPFVPINHTNDFDNKRSEERRVGKEC